MNLLELLKLYSRLKALCFHSFCCCSKCFSFGTTEIHFFGFLFRLLLFWVETCWLMSDIIVELVSTSSWETSLHCCQLRFMTLGSHFIKNDKITSSWTAAQLWKHWEWLNAVQRFQRDRKTSHWWKKRDSWDILGVRSQLMFNSRDFIIFFSILYHKKRHRPGSTAPV